MLPRVLLAVVLISVLVWTVTCARSRITTPPSDTPVPTLTPLPAANAATSMPTESPSQAPTATSTQETPDQEATVEESAALTSTAQVTSTAEVTATTELTEIQDASATEPVTETATMTATEDVAVATAATRSSASAPITGTVPLTETETVTDTAVVTETEGITETETFTDAEVETAESDAVAASSPESTTQITETSSITPTQEATATVEVVREAITLPTNLATSILVTDVTLLTDVVLDALPGVAELSPDGKAVAWLVSAQGRRMPLLCVADLDAGDPACVDVPGYQGMPYRIVWSPDGKWLAFSEDPIAQAYESDIWLLDVETSVVTNSSDDEADGRYADLTSEFALDYLPMWDAASGYLYFWRSTLDAVIGFGLQLMRLDPDSSEAPQVVHDFGTSLGDGMVRYGWQRFFLHGPSAIAPDGSQLAVAIAPAQEMDLSSSYALWLIDLADVDAEPRRVATALDWQSALPAWSNQPATVRGLQWTSDGIGIVVAALSSDLRLPLLVSYYVDVASGEVTPVVNFSDSRERSAFFRPDPETNHLPRLDAPWTVALAPNANVLLMVTDLGGVVRVLGAPLPPTGDMPVTLHEHRSPGYEAWTRSSGGGSKLLVYGLLMESVPLD